MSEIEQRVYITDLLDPTERLREVKVTFDELVQEDGWSEQQNEDFELDGEYVTYTELTDVFGEAKINAFIEEAVKQAR